MTALSDLIDAPAASHLRRAMLALRARAPMQPRAPLPGIPQRLTERHRDPAAPPGVCAACREALADEDAAETEGGQRVHRDGCPCDKARARKRRPV